MGPTKKIAVIGAGPAGIVTLKTVKQYGYNVTCFDLQPSFGGQWRVTPEMHKVGFEPLDGNQRHGFKCVYKSLVFNTGMYSGVFSDFPTDIDIDNAFWTPDSYVDYLSRYVEHFHLSEHFKFNTSVEKLEKVGKKWRVDFISQNEAGYDEFDHVIVASGPFRHPIFPNYKNKDAFKGVVVHSGQVRNEELLFKNKRVTVIGYGNSGIEMVCAALKADSTKVYMSMSYDAKRRQHWMGERYPHCPDLNKGKPHDLFRTQSNVFDQPDQWLQFIKSWVIPEKNINRDFIPGEDNINVTQVHVLLEKEKEGIFEKVVDVEQFFEDGMKLVDGKILDNIDVLVFATGYETRYPFLDGVWGRQQQQLCELYKYVIPTEEAMDGVCFVSTANRSGPLFPIMEMQARYICEKVLSRQYGDNGTLYNESERQDLLLEVQRQKDINQKMRRPYNFHTDYEIYDHNIAKELGCNPTDPTKMLEEAETRKDFELAVALQYGPVIGAQYRLRGPHTWNGAADFLISTARVSIGSKFDDLVEQHMKESTRI